jgi:hypothetical protein
MARLTTFYNCVFLFEIEKSTSVSGFESSLLLGACVAEMKKHFPKFAAKLLH